MSGSGKEAQWPICVNVCMSVRAERKYSSHICSMESVWKGMFVVCKNSSSSILESDFRVWFERTII